MTGSSLWSVSRRHYSRSTVTCVCAPVKSLRLWQTVFIVQVWFPVNRPAVMNIKGCVRLFSLLEQCGHCLHC